MKSVKEKGKRELKDFLNRVSKSYGMDRIDKEDFDYLRENTEEMLDYIDGMDEEDTEKE